MLDLGDALGHRWHGCRLADGLGRGSAGFLGDLPLGVCLIRRRDLADRIAIEVDPRRAGLERLQIAQGASVRFSMRSRLGYVEARGCRAMTSLWMPILSG